MRCVDINAYLIAQIMSYTSFKAKQSKNKITEKEIKALENEIIINNTPVLEHKLTILRAHYNEESLNKALTNLNRLKQQIYDKGEKAGKRLRPVE